MNSKDIIAHNTELINSTDALIDKVHLNNFRIERIDSIRKLKNRKDKYVEIKTDVFYKSQITDKQLSYANSQLISANNGREYYHRLQISKATKNNNKLPFDQLYYSLGKYGINAHIQISRVNDGFGNLNCATVPDFKQQLEDITEFCRTEFGITINFDNAEYCQIEVNKTVPLAFDFKDYEKAMQVMRDFCDGRQKFKNAMPVYDNDESKYTWKVFPQTLTAFSSTSGKNGKIIKFYDKAASLKKKGIDLTQDYMRFEITLHDKTLIKRSLSDVRVNIVSQEDINAYFDTFMYVNFVTGYKRYKDHQVEYLCNVLCDVYKNDGKKWKQKFINKLRNEKSTQILDIDEIDKVFASKRIRKLIPSKDTRYYSKEQIKKLAVDQEFLCNNDLAKYAELFEKLTGSPLPPDGTLQKTTESEVISND